MTQSALSLTPQSIMTDNWCAVDAARSIIGSSSVLRRGASKRAPPRAVHNTPPPVCTVNDLRRTLTTLERPVWFTRVSCSPSPTRRDDSGMCRPASRCATKQHAHSRETITSNDVNSHLIYTASTDVRSQRSPPITTLTRQLRDMYVCVACFAPSSPSKYYFLYVNRLLKRGVVWPLVSKSASRYEVELDFV